MAVDFGDFVTFDCTDSLLALSLSSSFAAITWPFVWFFEGYGKMKTVINDKTYMIFLIHSLNWFKKNEDAVRHNTTKLGRSNVSFFKGGGGESSNIRGTHTHTITKQSNE